MAGGEGTNGTSPASSSTSLGGSGSGGGGGAAAGGGGGAGGGGTEDVQARLKALNVTLLGRLKAAEARIAALASEVETSRDATAAAQATAAAATANAEATAADAAAAQARAVEWERAAAERERERDRAASAAKPPLPPSGGGGVESMLAGWVRTLQGWAQAVEAAVTNLWGQLMGALGKVAAMLPGGGLRGGTTAERAPLLT
ncbi:hypothetical protein MMPV_006306 [Pyropia vietnamensis]